MCTILNSLIVSKDGFLLFHRTILDFRGRTVLARKGFQDPETFSADCGPLMPFGALFTTLALLWCHFYFFKDGRSFNWKIAQYYSIGNAIIWLISQLLFNVKVSSHYWWEGLVESFAAATLSTAIYKWVSVPEVPALLWRCFHWCGTWEELLQGSAILSSAGMARSTSQRHIQRCLGEAKAFPRTP